MSEKKPERKVVSGPVAIALGIICIVLIAGLSEAVAYYSSTMSNKDTMIIDKDGQIDLLNTQISDQNNTISSLNTQLANLQEQISNINISGTVNSQVWVDDQTVNVMQGASWAPHNASSSGYILVKASSNNNSTYAEVLIDHPSNGILPYDEKVHVGFEGIAIFPIPSGIDVYVEVANSIGGGILTVTAIYYY